MEDWLQDVKTQTTLFFPTNTDRIHDSKRTPAARLSYFLLRGGKHIYGNPFRRFMMPSIEQKEICTKMSLAINWFMKQSIKTYVLHSDMRGSTVKKYGFIKRSQIENHNRGPIEIKILDGIQNLLPSGTKSKIPVGILVHLSMVTRKMNCKRILDWGFLYSARFL